MYSTWNVSKSVDPDILLNIKEPRHKHCPYCRCKTHRVNKYYKRAAIGYEDHEFIINYCICSDCDKRFILSPPVFWKNTMYSSIDVIRVLLHEDDVRSSDIAECLDINARHVRRWRKIYKPEQTAIKTFFHETRCANANELVKNLMNDELREAFEKNHPDMKLPPM